MSKIEFLAGTSINTKRISVNYPTLENTSNRKYILVDSADFESSILSYDDDDAYKYEKNNENEKRKWRR